MRRPALLALALAATPAWAQDAPASTDEAAAVPDEAAPAFPTEEGSDDVMPEATSTEPATVAAPEPVVAPEPVAEPVAEVEPAAEPEPESRKKRKKKKIKAKKNASGSYTLGESLELTFGGAVQYDLRFRPQDFEYGTYYNDVPEPLLLSRNELIGKFKVGAKMGKFGAKADLDFVFRGYPQPDGLEGLYDYNQVTPFRFEAHELYLYARDLFGARGLDIQIGQQKALFGVGDQFNPTNNVNPNDFEDVLLFGDQTGNLMVRLDYSPAWNWQLTGILVPVFKQALLPRTSYLAQTPDRYPFTDDETRWNLAAEQSLGETFGYPTVVRDIQIQQPEFAAENMQGFFRLATTLGGQDIALSYYRGFSDIPAPVRNDTYQVNDPRCLNEADYDRLAANEAAVGPCTKGVLASDVVLTYPRMHVLGFNMTGEFKVGYRFEFAMVFPERVDLKVVQHNIKFPLAPEQDGPYNFGETNGNVIDGRPFAKWTLGLDYSFGPHVYLNAQWVHGFPDEFGAGDWIQPGMTVRKSAIRNGASPLSCVDIATFSGQGETCSREWLKPRLGDYLVLGLDFNFAAQRGLFRLFTIWDMVGVFEETWDEAKNERVQTHHHMFTPEGFSAVIYPDFRWKFGNGFEWHAGALIQLGKTWTKFGAKENGGHQLWTRFKYSF